MNILDSLSRTESGGNFQAQNAEMGAGGQAGHFGRLQFGHARLQDAMRAGVLPQGTTPQQFMADPALQQRVEAWHLDDMRQQAVRMGLDQYIGQNVGGVPITMDAILAMGHLGGMGGAARYLQSGGQDNPQDAYGTSLRDYALTHGSPSAGSPANSPSGAQVASPGQSTPYQQAYIPTGQGNALAAQMSPEQMEQQRRMQLLQALPRYETNALNAADFMTQPNQNALVSYGFGPGNNPFV